MAKRPAPVVLKKDLARSIRRGHPWIYRDAITARESLKNGTLVEVQTKDRRPIARGFWDERSPIAVRIFESGGPGHKFADADELVAERLRAALDRRLDHLDLLDLAETNAFRWVHGEGDLLPGVHVDFYSNTAVVRFDGEGARAFYSPFSERLRTAADSRLPLEAILDRESRVGADERIVLENGLRFAVDLAHGQKGGLFLDQRENRIRVAQRARGKSVLNLFGYTGGFAVHAAAAGAHRTDTVDIARPAVEAARRNFELNGISLTNHGFHASDAFAFLTAAIERGDSWDIVISDPPSFAQKKDSVPAALHAYRRLHRLAASVVTSDGLLCAASCSSHIQRNDFLETISSSVRQAGHRWQPQSFNGSAFDHPTLPAFPEGDYLKFAIGRVR